MIWGLKFRHQALGSEFLLALLGVGLAHPRAAYLCMRDLSISAGVI